MWKGERGINGEFEINICILLYLIDNQQRPTVQQRNSAQQSVISCMRKESKKQWVHVYV